MKIGLQTWGTDGDFYPFLALAIGLKNAGHQVQVAHTSVDGKDYSERLDDESISILKADGDVRLESEFNPYAINAKPGSFKEYSILLEKYFEPFTDAMFNASEQLCKTNDLVIGHSACFTLHIASELHKTPRVSVALVPLIVESKHVSPIGKNLGVYMNKMMWSVGDKLSTTKWFKQGQKLRKSLGLHKVKSLQKEVFTSEQLTLVASSPSLFPAQPDWSAKIQVTGFLETVTDTDWKMPVQLQTFLEAREAPIYMTFGSAMQYDLKTSTELLVNAADQAGVRTIIQSDWNLVEKPTSENIFCIDSAPHNQIFKHCSMIVHHGGAGTTQAALFAGKPSVIVAHGFDQVFWANHLHLRKLAGKPLLRSAVSVQSLTNEISVVLQSDELKANAESISKKMKTENGVENAVAAIENLFTK